MDEHKGEQPKPRESEKRWVGLIFPICLQSCCKISTYFLLKRSLKRPASLLRLGTSHGLSYRWPQYPPDPEKERGLRRETGEGKVVSGALALSQACSYAEGALGGAGARE